MAFTSFIKKEELTAFHANGIQQEPTEFGELVSAGFKSTRDNFLTDSKLRLLDQEREENANIYKKITGESLKPSLPKNLLGKAVDLFGGLVGGNLGITSKHMKDFLFDKRVDELKKEDPERFKSLRSKDEMVKLAADRAKLSRQKFENLSAHASKFNRVVGGLIGGFAASTTDPLNIIALPLGGFGAKNLAGVALREAGINAGVEIASQPVISKWQREIGEEYGLNEAVQNIGFAALLGGSFPVVMRGVSKAASTVFSKLSVQENIPSSLKDSAKYLSRRAHIVENNPYSKNPDLDGGRHIKSIDIAAKSLNEGKLLDTNELPITNTEFKNIDTKITSRMSETQRQQMMELQRFQDAGDALAEAVIPSYNIKTLPDQILYKAKDRKALRVKDFTPEEMMMLEKAKIKPNANGQIKKDKLINEFNRRANEGILDTSDVRQRLDDDSHIQEFRESIRQSSLEIKDKTEEIKEFSQDIKDMGLVREDPQPIDIQREIFEKNESPQTIALEEAEFDSFVENNKDLTITFEDGDVKLSELSKRIDADDKLRRAILDCSSGILV